MGYDDLREAMGLDPGEGVGKVVHAADDQMRVWLRERQPFIVNATHLSKNMRARTLSLIEQYGAMVNVVCFEATMDVLIKRNEERGGTLKSSTLIKMAERWEMPGLDEVGAKEVRVVANPMPKFRPHSIGR